MMPLSLFPNRNPSLETFRFRHYVTSIETLRRVRFNLEPWHDSAATDQIGDIQAHHLLARHDSEHHWSLLTVSCQKFCRETFSFDTFQVPFAY